MDGRRDRRRLGPEGRTRPRHVLQEPHAGTHVLAGDARNAVDAGIAAAAALSGEGVGVLAADARPRGSRGRDRRDDEERSAGRREEHPHGSESGGHRRRALLVGDVSIMRFRAAGGPLIVGEGGLEPPRPEGHWHLKPARLPFRHSPQQPGEPITLAAPSPNRTESCPDSRHLRRVDSQSSVGPAALVCPDTMLVTGVVMRHAGNRACDQE